jgi:hypothetical protein
MMGSDINRADRMGSPFWNWYDGQRIMVKGVIATKYVLEACYGMYYALYTT